MHAFVAGSFFDLTFFEVIIGVAALFLLGFALVQLVRSDQSMKVKVVWAVVMIIIPIVGAFVYLLAGPSKALEFDAMDKPGITEQQRSDIEYEMTRRPLG